MLLVLYFYFAFETNRTFFQRVKHCFFIIPIGYSHWVFIDSNGWNGRWILRTRGKSYWNFFFSGIFKENQSDKSSSQCWSAGLHKHCPTEITLSLDVDAPAMFISICPSFDWFLISLEFSSTFRRTWWEWTTFSFIHSTRFRWKTTFTMDVNRFPRYSNTPTTQLSLSLNRHAGNDLH